MAHVTAVRRGSVVSATSNSTTWVTPTVSFTGTNGLNTAISTGEKVIWLLVVSGDGNNTLTEDSGTGWTKEGQAANSITITGALFTLETTSAFAAGAHPSFSITASGAEQYSAVMFGYRVQSGYNVGLIAEATSNGSSTNSDPASITNSSGASQDVTVFVSRSGDSTVTASAAPTNYGNLITQAAGGTAGASTNGANRQITIANSASEDPGTFTSASEQWVCWTIGVYEIATAASMPADVGSYTYTGTTTGLLRGFSMAADPGSYAVTGVDATLGLNVSTYTLIAEDLGPELNPDTGFDNAGQWNNTGTNWSVTGSKAVASGVSSTAIQRTDVPITAGWRYTASVNVTSYTSGSFSFNIASANFGSFNSAGVKTTVIRPTGGNDNIGLFGTSTLTAQFDDYSVRVNGYAYNGVDATFAKGRTMTADPGSYSITGVDATFVRTYIMPANIGSYAITGQTTNLLQGYADIEAVGSYTYTGVAANLLQGYADIEAVGSYTYTGVDATLLWAQLLTADPGSYVITGVDATLTKSGNPVLTADAGSYTISGQTVLFPRTYLMPADIGSYTISGQITGLLQGYADQEAVGSYVVTGVAANFLRTYIMPANVGSYTYSGVAAGLLKGRSMVSDVGSYTYSGVAAGLFRGLVVIADPGAYSLTGTAANFSRGRTVTGDIGSYLITGVDAGFLYNQVLTALVGSYVINTFAVSFALGDLSDLVPELPTLIKFQHNEAEVVRVPKLNAVAAQAISFTRPVLSMSELGAIAPNMGYEMHVWDGPSGYTPVYADGFNWRSMIDGSVVI